MAVLRNPKSKTIENAERRFENLLMQFSNAAISLCSASNNKNIIIIIISYALLNSKLRQLLTKNLGINLEVLKFL